jgi:hypothetical protein
MVIYNNYLYYYIHLTILYPNYNEILVFSEKMLISSACSTLLQLFKQAIKLHIKTH